MRIDQYPAPPFIISDHAPATQSPRNTVSKSKDNAERSAAAWSRVVENSASMADYPPPWDMPPPHEQHRVQDSSLSQVTSQFSLYSPPRHPAITLP